jgi:hypothetical protein
MNTKTERCLFTKVDQVEKDMTYLARKLDNHIHPEPFPDCEPRVFTVHGDPRSQSDLLGTIARVQANLNIYIRKCDDMRLKHIDALEDKNEIIQKLEEENKELKRKLKANEQISRNHSETCRTLRCKLEDKNGTINWQAAEIDKLQAQIKELEQINIGLVNREPIMCTADMVVNGTRYTELLIAEKKLKEIMGLLLIEED